MVYWALFLRHKDWNDIPKLEEDIVMIYDLANPNAYMVEKVVEKNQNFQDEQRKLREHEDEDRRNKILKMERMDQLKNMRDEAERLRKKRLAEAEAEK
jgi:energy-coupling factor transporter ATP-binding protein EcfA2